MSNIAFVITIKIVQHRNVLPSVMEFPSSWRCRRRACDSLACGGSKGRKSHRWIGAKVHFVKWGEGGWRLAILGLRDVAQPKPCRSPANGPRPTAQISDARVGTRALVASPLVLAYDAFLSGSMPGRRARPVLASPKAGGCTTGSGLVRTPGRALAAEGPRPRQTGRPGLADLMAL